MLPFLHRPIEHATKCITNNRGNYCKRNSSAIKFYCDQRNLAKFWVFGSAWSNLSNCPDLWPSASVLIAPRSTIWKLFRAVMTLTRNAALNSRFKINSLLSIGPVNLNQFSVVGGTDDDDESEWVHCRPTMRKLISIIKLMAWPLAKPRATHAYLNDAWNEMTDGVECRFWWTPFLLFFVVIIHSEVNCG